MEKSDTIEDMIQKSIIFISGILGIFFLGLGAYRMSLPYNESGNYFDGIVNYHEQSVGVFFSIGIILFIISIVLGYIRTPASR